MADRTGDATSRYDMGQGGSLPLLDLIGSKDSDGSGGTPDLQDDFTEFDGVADYISFTTGNSPISMSVDYTIMVILSLLGDIDAITARYMGGLTGGSTMLWNGTTDVLHFNPGATGNINVSVGEQLVDPVKFAIVMSHDVSAKTGNLAFKTSTGIANSGNFTYTGNPGNLPLALGRAKNGFTFCRYHNDLNFIASTFISEADSVDTAAAMIAPFLPPIPSVSGASLFLGSSALFKD